MSSSIHAWRVWPELFGGVVLLTKGARCFYRFKVTEPTDPLSLSYLKVVFLPRLIEAGEKCKHFSFLDILLPSMGTVAKGVWIIKVAL